MPVRTKMQERKQYMQPKQFLFRTVPRISLRKKTHLISFLTIIEIQNIG